MADFEEEEAGGKPAASSSETHQEVVARHKREDKELDGKIRALIKAAKKSEKAVVETQTIQMRFDLNALHNEEVERFEGMRMSLNREIQVVSEHFSRTRKHPDEEEPAISEVETEIVESNNAVDIAAKKAKAQKKKVPIPTSVFITK